MDTVTKYPEWLHAATRIVEGAYTYGDLIEHADMDALLMLSPPKGRMSEAEHDRYKLKRLSLITRLADYLLREHRMLLVSQRGAGYRILKPSDQTAYAIDAGDAAIRKALAGTKLRLVYVDHQQLDNATRQQNTDALVRTAAIAQTFRAVQRGKLPNVPKRLHNTGHKPRA